MSQPARSNRGHRERNGGQRPPTRDDRRTRPDSSSSPPPSYSRDAAPRPPGEDSKCTNVCSRRGIVLICAVLTNALVLICVVAAQMVVSGLSGTTSFDINSNFNLEGTQLQQARDLDMQYSQMRAPGVYGGVAWSLVFGVVSLLFVVAGTKPAHRMSRRLLVGQLAFQAAGAPAYVVAVGLYLHFVTTVNSTDVCKRRAVIYAGRGYTWMNCDVSGADAAVALFGLFTAILYVAGAALTFQTIRGVRRYLQEKQRQEEARGQAQRGPQRPDTTYL
ncbi:MARVEL domain-containing protein 3 [Austrofundulus limnaeus]|uniref:MARVEL domain-containing protein 3-like n=1 Tax=Austrofundulus limnaeus TaxID=52670 RepID=A0A2I4C7E7_AUSLI|nr:PREDICTED: MARVEL domain-containing protein 3-like [Austrofundulus limnaeus]XP_013875889.1 PREDICTED: MARVEL domain-containing protein 3-like [Austrofundulus limnaeus]